jgi:hypothetical protein
LLAPFGLARRFRRLAHGPQTAVRLGPGQGAGNVLN